ncbi:CAMK protein kinase [Magnaporthiopsis poae ATCC 64411]|uniref:Autophagy-related protein 1 n=1 Tax=Magnaporthiopsis poae (strain ATCC 64411 / 73-15) TaxID=644358 RepID=A0A0C4DXL8_MAGP6|nr:CAMK protein kinase [Magnaporthiopsis poae ATCC 64411]
MESIPIEPLDPPDISSLVLEQVSHDAASGLRSAAPVGPQSLSPGLPPVGGDGHSSFCITTTEQASPSTRPPHCPPGRSPPPPLSRLLSDLVLDSKLEATNLQSCIRHIFVRPGRAAGERFVTVEERWVREATLGEGAHGVVYRERLEGVGRIRAVKEIKKSACAELDYSRELEAIVKFSHPKYAHCFVNSSGWFELGDSIFISMEYLELGDLGRHIAQPLAEIESRQISSQVLEGLAYMHDNGFVHRDLKPGNIMVVAKQPKWFVKIADFGVSKRQLPDVTLQYTSKWLSFDYAAPEQLGFGLGSDKARVSPFAMDIWSSGAIAYRILTAAVPFRLGDLVAYAEGRCGFPYEPLRRFCVSETAVEFLATTMSASPGSRPSASAALRHNWFGEATREVTYNSGDAPVNASSSKDLTSLSNASAAWSTAFVDRDAGGATAKSTLRTDTSASNNKDAERSSKYGASIQRLGQSNEPRQQSGRESFVDASFWADDSFPIDEANCWAKDSSPIDDASCWAKDSFLVDETNCWAGARFPGASATSSTASSDWTTKRSLTEGTVRRDNRTTPHPYPRYPQAVAGTPPQPPQPQQPHSQYLQAMATALQPPQPQQPYSQYPQVMGTALQPPPPHQSYALMPQSPPLTMRRNECFLPRYGIDHDVIMADICRYLGDDAQIRPGYVEANGVKIPGYHISSYRALTNGMIISLREDSRIRGEQIRRITYDPVGTYWR